MTEPTLIEQADKIINQSVHTDDDIKQLARIKYFLSKLARSYDILANQQEEQYNLSRGSEFLKIKKKYKDEGERITDSEADRYAKDKSEDNYGSHRSAKANARGLYSTIEAVSQFIITIQSERKNSISGSYGIDQGLIEKIASES